MTAMKRPARVETCTAKIHVQLSHHRIAPEGALVHLGNSCLHTGAHQDAAG